MQEAVVLYANDWLRLELFGDQFLPGYTILYAPPTVTDLHVLEPDQQIQFLNTMAIAGAAILELTGARRMNYLIQGNLDPYLHAHIVPRFEWEESPWREGAASLYPPDRRVQMREHHPLPNLEDQLREALGAKLPRQN